MEKLWNNPRASVGMSVNLCQGVCVSYTPKPGLAPLDVSGKPLNPLFGRSPGFCQHLLHTSLERCSRSVFTKNFFFCHFSAVLLSVQSEQTENEGGPSGLSKAAEVSC